MKMHELLERNASRSPDKTFLFSEFESVSNRQARDVVQKVATAFRSFGVTPGDRVLIFAPNSINYVLAMFAAFELGAIAALIDVLDLESYRRNVRRLAPRLAISISSHLTDLKQASPKGTKFVSLDGGVDFAQSWDSLLAHDARIVPKNFKESDPCHLSFTSGTTYQPKPAILSHEPTLRATNCIAERLGLQSDDTSYGITTLSSSHILVYGLLPQMHRKAATGIIEVWDASQAWKVIHDRKVRLISGTAMRLSELADYAKEHGVEKGSVRVVLSGGSAGIGRIREKWKALGVTFVETYGMSELGGSVALGFPRPFESEPVKPFQRIPAIGPPLPDKEVKIVDEQGREVPVGVPGEILVRGGFMWGYWKMARETKKTTRVGWLHTSDVGIIDELDNVYWLARKTDVIESSRGPIYPRVIEEALFAHPSVRQACVVGFQEGEYQVPAGFVTLFPGEKIREEELLDHCKSTLDQPLWPSRVVIKDNFPMTPTGKIDKKKFEQE